MSQERYYIGPGLKDTLRDVIFRVKSDPHVTSGMRVTNVYSDIPPPIQSTEELRRGTASGPWAIGGTNAVTVTGSAETVRVTNYCVPIHAAAGSTQKYNVIFGTAGGVESAVEVQREGDVRLGTIDATWFKGDDATVTQIKGDGTEISPTVTFTAKNWFSSVIVTTGTKKVACAKVDQTWILIAAECE